jgi:hypothetical protein
MREMAKSGVELRFGEAAASTTASPPPTSIAVTLVPEKSAKPAISDGLAYSIVIGVGVVVAVLGVVVRSWLKPATRGEVSTSGSLKWQVDRASSIAKGIASTSAGFLLTLLGAVVTPKDGTGPTLALIGCLAGAVGAFLYAARLSRAARQAALDL